ncbi:MAG: hypothetical protein QMD71_03895 [bacterium]|nr:hypothetical protein [bacterium]
MRRTLPAVLLLILLGTLVVPKVAVAKGGCMSGLVGCLIGPRVGLELNEGKPVETTEWLRLILIGVLINDYQAFQKNGPVGCLLENFLGPRVGRQYDHRKFRTMELLGLLIPVIPYSLMVFEAYQGKTMTEIEAKENLAK